MKKMRKAAAFLLVFAIALSMMPQSVLAAKKKVKLSKKTMNVTVGKKVTLRLQNNKKKVKWAVTSGKKNISLSKKKKTSVVIKGKKTGKAKVQAKVGKKKYICKVTVKKKTAKATAAANTVKPKVVLTAVPAVTPTSTATTASPTPTAIATPTQTPEEEPSLYAREKELVISAVDFDQDIDFYMLNNNVIYVDKTGAGSVKDIVPDVKKCNYTVYSYGKLANIKSISNVKWHDESYYGDDEDEQGYYTFLLTVESGGKEYDTTVSLVRYLSNYEQEIGGNGILLTALQEDDKIYELEKSLYFTDEEDSDTVFFLKDRAQSLESIDTKKVKKVAAIYGEKEIILDVENVKYDEDTITFKTKSLKLGKLKIKALNLCIAGKMDDFFIIGACASDKGRITCDLEGIFYYEDKLDKGKTLKDVFTDLAKDLKIQSILFSNRYSEGATIENVTWHNSSYYDSGEDGGYYGFDVSITVNGKKITQSYSLVERIPTYKVSGKLLMEDGNPIADAKIEVKDVNDDSEDVLTDEEGNYSVSLKKGTYSFGVGSSFTVGESDLVNDMTLPVCKISGKVTRAGASTTKVPYIDLTSDTNKTLYVSDYGRGKTYYAYLEKGSYDVETCGWPNQKVGQINVTDSGSFDISLEVARVYGVGADTGFYTFSDSEDGSNNSVFTNPNGEYEIYLKPGTYDVKRSGNLIETIDVTLGDIEKNYKVYLCKGNMLDMKGSIIPPEFYNEYEISVKRNGKAYGKYTFRQGDDKGDTGYSMEIFDGRYEFFYEGASVGAVTVSGSDVVCDLSMPLKYVKVKIYDKEKHLIPLTQVVSLTTPAASGSSGSVSGYLYDRGGEGYSGSAVLPLGTYQCGYHPGTPDMTSQKFTVSANENEVEVNTNWCKVSGTCKVNGENASDKYWAVIKKKNDHNDLDSDSMEAGTYCFYLAPGDYTLKVYGENGEIRSEDFTVTDAPIVKNYELKVSEVSGKLSWGNGSKYDANDKWIYLSGDKGIFNSIVDKEGNYLLKAIPFGTYEVRYQDVSFGNVTVDATQKKFDFVLSGYQITATAVDEDGKPLAYENFTFINSEDSSDTRSFVSSYPSGEMCFIVQNPGTYNVFYKKNGVSIPYGTVTVTDKNVTCTLRKSET